MADSGPNHATLLESPPLQAKPPSLTQSKRSSRHVRFSELPPKHHTKKRRRFCLACCFWATIAASASFLFLVLIGILLASFLLSALPEITIRSVNYSNLESLNPNSSPIRDASVDAGLEFVVEFANSNSRIELSFESLSAEVAWEEVKVQGKTEMESFSERPRESKALGVRTRMGNENEKEKVLDSETVLDLVIRGIVGFHVGMIDVNGIPLWIQCNPKQAEIDLGLKPLCRARIFGDLFA